MCRGPPPGGRPRFWMFVLYVYNYICIRIELFVTCWLVTLVAVQRRTSLSGRNLRFWGLPSLHSHRIALKNPILRSRPPPPPTPPRYARNDQQIYVHVIDTYAFSLVLSHARNHSECALLNGSVFVSFNYHPPRASIGQLPIIYIQRRPYRISLRTTISRCCMQ